MKYCSECGSEYNDGVTVCSDDGNTELVDSAEMKARGIPTATDRDTRKFVRAGTAEDPLSAERFSQLLQEQGIPVFARPRRTGSTDNLTGGSVMPWWELLVPEDSVERASRLLNEAKEELDATADEAALAAEAEATGKVS